MRYVALGINHGMFPKQCKIEKHILHEVKPFFDEVVISAIELQDQGFIEDINDELGLDLAAPAILPMLHLEPGDELLVIEKDTEYHFSVYTVGSI